MHDKNVVKKLISTFQMNKPLKYSCPTCHTWIKDVFKGEFCCPNCGQKLKWGGDKNG